MQDRAKAIVQQRSSGDFYAAGRFDREGYQRLAVTHRFAVYLENSSFTKAGDQAAIKTGSAALPSAAAPRSRQTTSRRVDPVDIRGAPARDRQSCSPSRSPAPPSPRSRATSTSCGADRSHIPVRVLDRCCSVARAAERDGVEVAMSPPAASRPASDTSLVAEQL